MSNIQILHCHAGGQWCSDGVVVKSPPVVSLAVSQTSPFMVLQVGQVNSVEEFESEKLYKLQVLVGEGLSRQVTLQASLFPYVSCIQRALSGGSAAGF